MSLDTEISTLVYSLFGRMPQMASQKNNPQMPNANPENMLVYLKHDPHLVKQYSLEQKRWILETFGLCLSRQTHEFFQTDSNKTYKRSIESIIKARCKIAEHGGGWFYYGMTRHYTWKMMIDFINKILITKSIEKVWIEKMKDQLLAPCPICKNPISYTSCTVKLVNFDHRITCKSCSDHDP